MSCSQEEANGIAALQAKHGFVVDLAKDPLFVMDLAKDPLRRNIGIFSKLHYGRLSFLATTSFRYPSYQVLTKG